MAAHKDLVANQLLRALKYPWRHRYLNEVMRWNAAKLADKRVANLCPYPKVLQLATEELSEPALEELLQMLMRRKGNIVIPSKTEVKKDELMAKVETMQARVEKISWSQKELQSKITNKLDVIFEALSAGS